LRFVNPIIKFRNKIMKNLDENLCGHILILRKGHQPISKKCYDCTGYKIHRETKISIDCGDLYTTIREIREHEKEQEDKARRNF